MYVGVFAILAYFMIVPGICELGGCLYSKSKGGKSVVSIYSAFALV